MSWKDILKQKKFRDGLSLDALPYYLKEAETMEDLGYGKITPKFIVMSNQGDYYDVSIVDSPDADKAALGEDTLLPMSIGHFEKTAYPLEKLITMLEKKYPTLEVIGP
tara:strand:+ start:46 stop:369 length:324 start_codon:yes stop_codon:yes gene_type:complete